jgi:hypothetical protein
MSPAGRLAALSFVIGEMGMSRYFFELQDGNSRLHDHEGQEFRGPDEAEVHARHVAYELARNHSPADLNGSFLVLLDGERNEIVTIPLNEFSENAASPPKTQRLVH